MKNKDTIVAVSTPPGIGGVGIVRLSGPDSLHFAKKIFSPVGNQNSWTHSHLCYGIVHHPVTNERLDDGYAVFFRSPQSFTGEDVVELQLHGNPYLLSCIVGLFLEVGARLAQPGEFTKRSYLNGKIDLLQAEAVSELIHSQSIVEAKNARLRLDGKLSSRLEKLREETIDVLAEIEANIDFPDEDIEPKNQIRLLSMIDQMLMESKFLLETYNQNQKIASGFRIALVGKPNVGKSSLFNAILQDDRAIVAPQAGTTRDVLSEEVILGGHRVKFFDTAGLHPETIDPIEKEGMSRSVQQIENADLVLWIGSTVEKYESSELLILKNVSKDKCWLIWNKCDLQPPTQTLDFLFGNEFLISSKTGSGIHLLLEAVQTLLHKNHIEEFGGGISNDRQKELMSQLNQYFATSIQMIKEESPPELIAVEFRQSYHHLNRLLGKEEDMEAMYDRIFSKFCVGK